VKSVLLKEGLRSRSAGAGHFCLEPELSLKFGASANAILEVAPAPFLSTNGFAK